VRKEALLWNTRFRMQRGVGVAGNGVGLLNGQTSKSDSIDSPEGGGVVYGKVEGLFMVRWRGCLW
jgi:hypothetical protein